MAATALNSPRAVEVSVYVVRAFVRLREAAVLHKDLPERLSSLEEKTEALRELTIPPEPAKRSIGFITHEDKPSKLSGTKARTVDKKTMARIVVYAYCDRTLFF